MNQSKLGYPSERCDPSNALSSDDGDKGDGGGSNKVGDEGGRRFTAAAGGKMVPYAVVGDTVRRKGSEDCGNNGSFLGRVTYGKQVSDDGDDLHDHGTVDDRRTNVDGHGNIHYHDHGHELEQYPDRFRDVAYSSVRGRIYGRGDDGGDECGGDHNYYLEGKKRGQRSFPGEVDNFDAAMDGRGEFPRSTDDGRSTGGGFGGSTVSRWGSSSHGGRRARNSDMGSGRSGIGNAAHDKSGDEDAYDCGDTEVPMTGPLVVSPHSAGSRSSTSEIEKTALIASERDKSAPSKSSWKEILATAILIAVTVVVCSWTLICFFNSAEWAVEDEQPTYEPGMSGAPLSPVSPDKLSGSSGSNVTPLTGSNRKANATESTRNSGLWRIWNALLDLSKFGTAGSSVYSFIRGVPSAFTDELEFTGSGRLERDNDNADQGILTGWSLFDWLGRSTLLPTDVNMYHRPPDMASHTLSVASPFGGDVDHVSHTQRVKELFRSSSGVSTFHAALDALKGFKDRIDLGVVPFFRSPLSIYSSPLLTPRSSPSPSSSGRPPEDTHSQQGVETEARSEASKSLSDKAWSLSSSWSAASVVSKHVHSPFTLITTGAAILPLKPSVPISILSVCTPEETGAIERVVRSTLEQTVMPSEIIIVLIIPKNSNFIYNINQMAWLSRQTQQQVKIRVFTLGTDEAAKDKQDVFLFGTAQSSNGLNATLGCGDYQHPQRLEILWEIWQANPQAAVIWNLKKVIEDADLEPEKRRFQIYDAQNVIDSVLETQSLPSGLPPLSGSVPAKTLADALDLAQRLPSQGDMGLEKPWDKENKKSEPIWKGQPRFGINEDLKLNTTYPIDYEMISLRRLALKTNKYPRDQYFSLDNYDGFNYSFYQNYHYVGLEETLSGIGDSTTAAGVPGEGVNDTNRNRGVVDGRGNARKEYGNLRSGKANNDGGIGGDAADDAAGNKNDGTNGDGLNGDGLDGGGLNGDGQNGDGLNGDGLNGDGLNGAYDTGRENHQIKFDMFIDKGGGKNGSEEASRRLFAFRLLRQEAKTVLCRLPLTIKTINKRPPVKVHTSIR